MADNKDQKDRTYLAGIAGSTTGTLLGGYLGTKEGKRIKDRLRSTADRYAKHKQDELSGINIDTHSASKAYRDAKDEAAQYRAVLGSEFAGPSGKGIQKFDVYDDRMNQPYERFGNVQRGDLVHLDDHIEKPPYTALARKVRDIDDPKVKGAMDSYVKAQLKANDAQIHSKNMENLTEMRDDLLKRNRVNASTFMERADHEGARALLKKRLAYGSAGKVMGGFGAIGAYKLYKHLKDKKQEN